MSGDPDPTHDVLKPGDTITATVRAVDRIGEATRLVLECTLPRVPCDAAVAAPAGTVRPAIEGSPADALGLRLRDMTRGLAPLRTAVVHPVDALSLQGAIAAAQAGLIVPVLVGPEARIRAVAVASGIDLEPYELIPTPHSDAAAEAAVALARNGRVEALMKGALHTDELLHAVVEPQSGLRTKRRISHVFAIDVPGHDRTLYLTDAAIHVHPSLDEKRDIVQNAIDLVCALGVAEPRVALLSAVETVSASIPSSVDAAALCKMAERGQITGGVLDGPLGFDNAVSEAAARAKGIASPVAGRADILVVPELESGNMLAKQLEYLAGATIAGIALGARVPIVLTSRADGAASRLRSCAIALLWVRRHVATSASPGLLP